MRCLLLVVCLLFFAQSQAQNKKLSVIGSSTSACTGPSSYATCYLGRLDTYQDGIGQPIDIFQLAVGGYNQYKGMPSSFVGPTPSWQPDPNNNITKALSFNPDVVLVNYPTNDYDVIPLDSVMRCLRTIRDSAKIQGKTCYITTTQPRHGFPFNTLANRQKLKVLRDSILIAFGYFAINFWDGLVDPTTLEILPAYNSGDNIHLNDAGHDILFQRVRDKNIFNVGLPVKLASFAARLQHDEIVVNWSVFDELAGVQYELQRSTNGSSFETLQTLTAGAAASKRNYQVVDNSVVAGVYYYRLRVTENGRSFFSQVIKVSGSKNTVAMKSFAVDPSRKQVVIKLAASESKNVQVRVMNSNGALISKHNYTLQTGENRIVLPTNSFPAGIYMAECISDNTRVFTKSFRTL